MKRILLACAALVMATQVSAQDRWPVEHRWLANVSSTKPKKTMDASARWTDLAAGAWQLYRSVFMTADGRIVDRENGEISHSESQGYGMLIAATLGDREAFDRIWDWTERELFVREDNLAAWKWDPSADPHITDMNNATDGDVLIAWALLRAYKRWNVRDHLREAEAIVRDVVSETIVDTQYGKVMLPGVEGFSSKDRSDGPVVNLSYWVFPAVEELSRQMPFLAKTDLNANGLSLVREIADKRRELPSEWTALGDDKSVPADGFDPVFGYNALRIPLYLAWSRTSDPQVLETLDAAWKHGGEAGLSMIDVETGNAVEPITGHGYEAISELAHCSLGRDVSPDATKAFEPSSYYSSTLQILTMIAFSERYPECF